MDAIEKKITAFNRLLKQALLIDAQWARRELARLRSDLQAAKPVDRIDQRFEKTARRIRESIAICKERGDQRCRLAFDPELPISAKKEIIEETIRDHQVVIITGETGSGKTTQLPKMCLAAGRGVRGNIGVTQPRRIAATTVSRRIAQELGESLGQTVGYKIRFQDTISAQTRVKVMTDGILLSEIHKDRLLFQYDTLIVDEAHERSLNIDFILGLLKQLIKKRRDLKIIITSATIDTEKFSKAFDQAPVISVSGRMYPVEIRWSDPSDEADADSSHIDMAVDAVDKLLRLKKSGDVLVFMPTEQDIRDTCEMLEGRRHPHAKIIPLFARLSAAEQQRVFDPLPQRKIIVATNVAETSITIPGIRFVVDSGLARIPQYTPRSRTTTMPVVPVSRSSADQRSGRCGRVADGICIRLFSEEDYNNRSLFTPPEILRSNLADVILRMTALKLGDVASFAFIDPPAPARIQDGYNLLLELGAIRRNTSSRKNAVPYVLTGTGRLMARLPLDPRLSRMLIEAHSRGCLDDVAIIAAALSIQDPRERPVDKQAQADAAQATFADPMSDFAALLNIWHAYHQKVKNRSAWKDVKRFCRDHFLSFRRMREWKDIYRQIVDVLGEQNIRAKQPSQTRRDASDLQNSWYAAVHNAVLSGFLSNIALKKENRLFQASHNREAMIFPGSGLFKNPGNWIVASEMVETSRLFARCAAVISPDWLEPIGKDQCKYSYRDPHWERKREEVVVTEQVSLYGLVIATRKRSFGAIQPEDATDIFIRQALIQGDVRKPLPFMKHNASVIAGVEEMEQRLRRRDLLVEEEELVDFYRERIGIVYSLKALQHLIRQKGGDRFLRMQPDQVMLYRPLSAELAGYPEQMRVQGHTIDYRYHFAPGDDTDGITAHVPAGIAAAMKADSFQWLVPGLLKDKITALVKALPKELRRQLVPVAETVAVIAGEMPIQPNTSLAAALSDFIRKRFNVVIPPAAWDENDIPEHLRMRYAVTNEQGQVIQTGRDAAILKKAAADSTTPRDFDAARARYEKKGIDQWDFGDLPESIRLPGPGGHEWTAFPALEKRETGLVLTAFADKLQAQRSHRAGVRALSETLLGPDIKYLCKNLALPPACDVPARYFGGLKKLDADLVDRVLDDLLAKPIRSERDFAGYLEQIRSGGFAGMGQTTRRCVIEVLDHYHGFRRVLANLEKAHPRNVPGQQFLTALRSEMEQVIPAHFIALYADAHLKDLVRYIKAAIIRAERGINDLEKDRGKQNRIEPVVEAFTGLVRSLAATTSAEKREAVEELFWSIQELKISIFAQEIKTAFPVSPKKIRLRIKEIQKMV